MKAKHPRHTRPGGSGDDEAAYQDLGDGLSGVLDALFSIEGVEGVGQDVTVLRPWDLPPHLLGFVELLRAGAIERDEEIILITVPPTGGRRRKKQLVLERVRQSLLLLCRY